MKCRFCNARFAPRKIGDKNVLERMLEHTELFHGEEWEKLRREIREVCHRAPLRADHPVLYT